MDSRKTNQGDGDERTTENVVRLPRDWLGPREELVPIGPRARAAQPPDTESLPPTAASFWGEDSGSLHSPMEAPRDPSLGDGAPAASGAARRPRAMPRLRLGVRGSRAARIAPRRRAGAAAVVGLLVVCVVVVLAAIGQSEGGTHNPRATAASLSPNASIPTVTGVNRARLRALTKTVTHTNRRQSDARTKKSRVRARVNHHRATSSRHGHRAGTAPRLTHRTTETVVATTSTPAPAATSAPTTGSPPTETVPTNAPATAQSTSSGSGQSAFGATGQLGPGSSPDG